jgi:hypothetical protein
MKYYPLIATKYRGKKMLAPMYFLGDIYYMMMLKKEGYNIKRDMGLK